MEGSKGPDGTSHELDQTLPRRDAVPSRQGRRGQSGLKKRNEQTIDYESLGIPSAAVPLFEEAREMFSSIGRKRTDEVFTCGEALSRVRESAPSQEAFERWSKRACSLTRRGAGNYIAVHNNLREHRNVLVDCSMPAAAMYTLATAEQELLASVVADLKAGKRPTVREIKTLVSGETQSLKREPADTAGSEGLRALSRQKIQNAVPILVERLWGILKDIQEALEPHFEGKKVAKGALVGKVEHPARRAGAELQSLAVFVEPNAQSSSDWIVHPARLPHGSQWWKVSQVLYKLGGREDWPDASELGAWLVNDVVPALEFAVGATRSKDAVE
ncbi:hypothetical protein NKJ06_03630 [Mesorhizobium sp. M0293]|uniref:hypothetical protein n=1 Tax=Mesorhizobium sp. M0293 TaxID=2956930 RepID=UPI00333BA166